MKQNKLPQYWIVQQCNDPRFQKVVAYMNTISEAYVGDDTNSWYGFDGNSFRNGTNWADYPHYFKNNPVQLTLDQFIEMTEPFVLPDLWCIRGCPEFKDWHDDNTNVRGENIGCHYFPLDTKLKRWDFGYSTPKSWTEITFDQFLEFVVNKPVVVQETIEFNPLDWNIECANASQTQEVIDFIRQNCSQRAGEEHDDMHYKFMRFAPTNWNGNDSRNANYPIEKSISWEQFQSLKKSTMKEVIETPSTDQLISRTDLAEIHAVACEKWKTTLSNKAKNTDAFNNLVSFSAKEVKEMFDACTASQLPVVEKFFSKPVTDKNAFIVSEGNRTKVQEMSKQLFNNSTAMQILASNGGDAPKELVGKAFFVGESFVVNTGKLPEGGTWISIFEK